jgi:hypothetical protein
MKRLRNLSKRTVVVAAAVAIASTVTAAGAAKLVTSGDIKNSTIKLKDLSPKVRSLLSKSGALGAPGAQGAQGAQGGPGTNASNNETNVTNLGGAFSATNGSCSLTPDGVECGPYANGGSAGGSLLYTGLNGQPLSAVRSLAYFARYTSDGDTGGVGVPYLRIFLQGDAHDAIFSPNTQPPDPDTAEGPFHTWVATSGLWRYDDDAGAGGQYGVTGAPFSQVVTDHGSEVISGIYISTGFTAGTNLNSLTRVFEVNGQEFEFHG